MFLQILDIVAKIVFVVVFFGLCIFVHELGHLLAALKCGLHVERFSVGFGKKIWGTTYKGVEYWISMIPLGGYVSLPQLDPTDTPTTSDGKSLKPGAAPSRAITAFAGPLANVVFGFFLALFITWFGIYGPTESKECEIIAIPTIQPLFKDGLEVDDEILTVNGEAVKENSSWWSICDELPPTKGPIKLTVRRGEGEKQETVDIEYTPVANKEYEAGLRKNDIITEVNGKTFSKGFREMVELIVLNTDELELTIKRGDETKTVSYLPDRNPDYDGLGYPFFTIRQDIAAETVYPQGSAARAGIQDRDIFKSVNGTRVISNESFVRLIDSSQGAPMTLVVTRDGKDITIENLRAEKRGTEKEARYMIGVKLGTPKVLTHPSPWKQFTDVIDRTVRTLKSLGAKAVPGRRSLVRGRDMTSFFGIISMMLAMVFSQGYIGGLSFVVLITFSLAFMNLLPMPVLDGGHIVYALIEMIFRRKVPTKIVHALQNVFAALLIMLMLYISFFDVTRMPRYWKMISEAMFSKKEQVELEEKVPDDKPSEETTPAAPENPENK